MIFTPTSVDGAFVIDVEPVGDNRGGFARTWCQREFEARGLKVTPVQCSVSMNPVRGTIRGMHYQADPHGEPKLVRCTRGAVYDVVLDIRPMSPTFRRWISVELTEANRRSVYAPPGTAHGFQTLAPDSEVYYQIAQFYEPSSARGVRWDDPFFGIQWPDQPAVMSERDQGFPLWGDRP